MTVSARETGRDSSYMERAEAFSSDSLGKYLRNLSPSVTWANKGSRYFYYSPHTSSGRGHFLTDTQTWKTYRMSPGEEKHVFHVTIGSRQMHYDSRTGTLAPPKDKITEKTERNRRRPEKHPWYDSYCADSTFYVRAIDNDIWLFNAATSDSTRLSRDGEHYFSYSISGDKSDEASGRGGTIGRWVGRSHKRLLIREDKRSVGTLTLVNSLSQGRPRTQTYKFAMPGDTGVVRYDVAIADADSGKLYHIDMARFKDQHIRLPRFSMFPHTDRYAWLIRVSRTCDTLDLCRIDVTDRSVKTIISEVCHPHYNEQLFSYHILNDGKEILWWSERSGKGRWYLYDSEGRLKNEVTSEDFVSAHIARIDTAARKIVFEGYGKEEGVNPHYRFFYEASLDGKQPARLLTPGNGHHSISFSPDGRYIVDTYSRMDMAPKHQITDRKGKVRMSLQGCEVDSLISKGWKYPEVVSVKAADGKTDLYGVVYTPFEMEEGRRYPIISCVYPGPQTDLVPWEFYLDENANQSLAQLGFVVINFAYRGSGPYRGKDFHCFGYGNLRDYPLDDDHAVIRQIAELYPFADSTRVGIYGHSGGGFMAVAAMLERPDFYKVGIAASGNHDNNIYSQWWGETFHGVTNEDGCFCCDIPTNIEKAANLKGRLLLITGDMDNNVHPAGTLRMADALIRHRKRFDMMVIPGADHSLGDKYYINLIRYYFTEHLLGLPQKDIDIVNHK